ALDVAAQAPVALDEFFTLAHIGSFSPARNVPTLWKAIAEACAEDPYLKEKLRIKVVGTMDHSVRTSMEEAGIADRLVHIPYLPHDEVMQAQRTSHALLLVVNRSKNAKGILTGKVFEYLVAQRPVLAVGPPAGDLDLLLQKVGAGAAVHWDHVTKEHIFALKTTHATGNAEAYSREALCKKLVGVIEG
ncbi:MAG: hypothetical protein P8O05_06385, partial [Flavobacteriales bacterium]|nr:hypothetical protein [Flavobacteriales bacterium]